MTIRKIRKMVSDKRAVSNAISVTVLTGAVIALSLAVFTWSQSRSSAYNREFGETVDAETARLKEKLIFEYIFYNSTELESGRHNLTAFLMNCGSIDGVEIRTVYIYNSNNVLIGVFSNPPLYHFQGWDEIPGQVLDMGDEGRLVLSLSSSLSGFCNIEIVTVRGATFESGFVA